MNDLFHKRNKIYNNVHLLFDPNVQLTFFVYNISSLGPSLHSVNRQRALHKMNTKFQFGTSSTPARNIVMVLQQDSLLSQYFLNPL